MPHLEKIPWAFAHSRRTYGYELSVPYCDIHPISLFIYDTTKETFLNRKAISAHTSGDYDVALASLRHDFNPCPISQRSVINSAIPFLSLIAQSAVRSLASFNQETPLSQRENNTRNQSSIPGLKVSNNLKHAGLAFLE